MSSKHKLYFTVKGEGNNPSLFLHGLWGGGNYFRDFDFSNLSLTPMYFPDLLGFGKSQKPHKSYTPQVHVESLEDIISSREKITIIANSFGCIIACYVAYYYPEHVKQLILISPILYKDQKEAEKYLSTRLIPKLTIRYPRVASYICFLSCKMKLLKITAPLLFRGDRKKFYQQSIEHTWHSYYSTFTECFTTKSIIPIIKKVTNTTPTLILYGKHDNYINKETIESLKGKYLTSVEVKNGSHNMLFEQFDYCKEKIIEWINR